MWQIYTSLPDLWIDEARCRRNPVKWYPSQGKFPPDWLYAPTRSFTGLAQYLPECHPRSGNLRHTLNTATKKRASELLEQYGLKQFASARPSQLSGGMRQRAALIRTLLPDPQLLLLDEPFSALDYQTRLTVSDDIGQIIRQSGKTALLVTHDLSEAISLSDRVIVLTNRPAKVRCEIPIFFKLEQDTPLNRRNAPEFKHYFNQIWKELNHDN